MLTEKTFDTGELTLAYLENESSNPPIVLLHGLTGWRADWNNFAPLLTANWHIYMPELRGHGNSGRGASYRLADYDRDIIAFLRHVGQPVVLVGFSLGALIALTVAAEYPQGVRALVLIDPPLFTAISGMSTLPTEGKGYFQWVYEITKDNPSYETMLNQCAAALPPGTDESAVTAMADQLSRVASGTVEAALTDKLWHEIELPAALDHIQPPTLMIHGDWASGAVVREGDIPFVQQHLPSAQIIRVPNAGHLIPIEHPNLVLQHVNAFLQST
ncbi:MAG: alpha/beta hydrolase [Chloroflexota bacterium]